MYNIVALAQESGIDYIHGSHVLVFTTVRPSVYFFGYIETSIDLVVRTIAPDQLIYPRTIYINRYRVTSLSAYQLFLMQ